MSFIVSLSHGEPLVRTRQPNSYSKLH